MDLPGLHIADDAVLRIHQEIEALALDADAVVLRAVRQGMAAQGDVAVGEIEEAQNLNLLSRLLLPGKPDKRRLVERPGVHLQKVRRPGHLHQRVHRAQQLGGQKAGQREHEGAHRHEQPRCDGEQGIAFQVVPQNPDVHAALLSPGATLSSARTARMG